MAGLEVGPSGVRNPRKLTREQVLETLDSDSDVDFDSLYSSDDSGTSSDSDDEQPAVGSKARSNPVLSQEKSRSSSTSDEAEIVVDKFGWRIVHKDQGRSRSRSDPAFTAWKASHIVDAKLHTAHPFVFKFFNINLMTSNRVRVRKMGRE